MKKIFLIFILFSINSFSQVGVNTSSPQTALDVEGNMRIATTEESTTAEYVLTVDDNQIVKKIPITTFGSGGTDVVDSRIYAIIPKNTAQYFQTNGTNYNVKFDGTITGINISNISVSSDQTSINFPANKAFKVTGMIGVKGKTGAVTSGNPAYITSKFVAGTGSTLVISTQGYSESSTERYDDGGVTNPIIIFTTGDSGGSIQLSARFAGGDAGTTGYYLAGQPTDSSIGTYFIIEEL